MIVTCAVATVLVLVIIFVIHRKLRAKSQSAASVGLQTGEKEAALVDDVTVSA